MKREIINKLLHSPPTIQVGKQGISESVIQELNDQLKKKKAVKIRLLKSVANVEMALQELEQQSNGKIAKKIGNTAIIVQSDA
ncbi:MAG: YhbY family RNA-binding protein [Candidatus Thorarchaeota archaeon]